MFPDGPVGLADAMLVSMQGLESVRRLIRGLVLLAALVMTVSVLVPLWLLVVFDKAISDSWPFLGWALSLGGIAVFLWGVYLALRWWWT